VAGQLLHREERGLADGDRGSGDRRFRPNLGVGGRRRVGRSRKVGGPGH